MLRRALVTLGLASCRFPHEELAAPPMPDAITIDGTPLEGEGSGLVAWYPMEALSTGQAPDASGNGHTGACGSCPTVAAGRVAMAYVFSDDDRIDVIANGGLASMTGLTTAFWMRLDTTPTYYVCPINKGFGPGPDDTWAFCLDPSRQPQFYTTDGVRGDRMTAGRVYPVGEWHHVAITWDGSTKQLWYDGVSLISNTGKTLAFDLRDLTIGADVDNLTTHDSWVPLPGALDDVRIYDHALTAETIAALVAM